MKNSKQRMIATITMLLVAMVGTFGQVTNTQFVTRPTYTHTPWSATNYDNSNTETATVGAEMPYYVERDANVNITGIFTASTFKWAWTAAEFSAVKGYDATLPAITSGTETSYNFVVATMPTSVGTSTLNVTEVSHPVSGTGCEGNTTSLAISVVAKPTFSLTAGSTGSCTPAVQNLPVVLTGVAPYYVDYEISAVKLDGTLLGTTKTYNATIPTAVTTLEIDPSQLLDVSGVVAPALPTAGKYTVTVKNVWDTYSWKAINYSALAVVPTTATYDIYVYPTPVTSPIQHIKQL